MANRLSILSDLLVGAMGQSPARVRDFLGSLDNATAARLIAAAEAGDNRAILKAMSGQTWGAAPARVEPPPVPPSASRDPVSFRDRIASDPNVRAGLEDAGIPTSGMTDPEALKAYVRNVRGAAPPAGRPRSEDAIRELAKPADQVAAENVAQQVDRSLGADDFIPDAPPVIASTQSPRPWSDGARAASAMAAGTGAAVALDAAASRLTGGNPADLQEDPVSGSDVKWDIYDRPDPFAPAPAEPARVGSKYFHQNYFDYQPFDNVPPELLGRRVSLGKPAERPQADLTESGNPAELAANPVIATPSAKSPKADAAAPSGTTAASARAIDFSNTTDAQMEHLFGLVENNPGFIPNVDERKAFVAEYFRRKRGGDATPATAPTPDPQPSSQSVSLMDLSGVPDDRIVAQHKRLVEHPELFENNPTAAASIRAEYGKRMAARSPVSVPAFTPMDAALEASAAEINIDPPVGGAPPVTNSPRITRTFSREVRGGMPESALVSRVDLGGRRSTDPSGPVIGDSLVNATPDGDIARADNPQARLYQDLINRGHSREQAMLILAERDPGIQGLLAGAQSPAEARDARLAAFEENDAAARGWVNGAPAPDSMASPVSEDGTVMYDGVRVPVVRNSVGNTLGVGDKQYVRMRDVNAAKAAAAEARRGTMFSDAAKKDLAKYGTRQLFYRNPANPAQVLAVPSTGLDGQDPLTAEQEQQQSNLGNLRKAEARQRLQREQQRALLIANKDRPLTPYEAEQKARRDKFAARAELVGGSQNLNNVTRSRLAALDELGADAGRNDWERTAILETLLRSPQTMTPLGVDAVGAANAMRMANAEVFGQGMQGDLLRQRFRQEQMNAAAAMATQLAANYHRGLDRKYDPADVAEIQAAVETRFPGMGMAATAHILPRATRRGGNPARASDNADRPEPDPNSWWNGFFNLFTPDSFI